MERIAMTRQTAARTRAQTEPNSRQRLDAKATSQCVLACVVTRGEHAGERRAAKKDGQLCSVCETRIDRQAKESPAWRIQMQTIYTSRLAGFDYISTHTRRR